MILTKEILQATDACQEGYRFGLEAGIVGGDYDAAIEYCNANGQQDYAEWLVQNKNTIASWKASGVDCTEQFGFFCHLEEKYRWFTTQQEATNEMSFAKQSYRQSKKSLFPVVLERANERGDTTWVPVDIETFSDEGDFQVFNQMTGVHTRVAGKDAAIAKRDEFLNAYCNQLEWIVVSNYIDANGVMTTDMLPIQDGSTR